MKRQYVGVALLLCMLVAGVVLVKSGYVPNLATLQNSREALQGLVTAHPLLAPFVFSLIYISVVALSLPVATPLSLLAGFLFGVVFGTLLVVVSATVGACATFFLARTFFREYFMEKVRAYGYDASRFGTFGDVLIARLIPAVPFWFINAVSGLTNVRLGAYAIATIMGIAPFSFVYVLAGTRLGELHSFSDVLSGKTIATISIIGAIVLTFSIFKRTRKVSG